MKPRCLYACKVTYPLHRMHFDKYQAYGRSYCVDASSLFMMSKILTHKSQYGHRHTAVVTPIAINWRISSNILPGFSVSVRRTSHVDPVTDKHALKVDVHCCLWTICICQTSFFFCYWYNFYNLMCNAFYALWEINYWLTSHCHHVNSILDDLSLHFFNEGFFHICVGSSTLLALH